MMKLPTILCLVFAALSTNISATIGFIVAGVIFGIMWAFEEAFKKWV